jgi:transcriptional regulator with XRE-family HTH domain
MRRIEAERRKQKLSQSSLSRLAGMHATTVGQIEKGYIGKPYPSQLMKLARALNWPVERAEELLEEVPSHDQ